MVTIPPKSGKAFKIKKNSFLKVICPEGAQVCDMVAYNTNDIHEFLSNGKTFDYEQTIRLTTGNILYSNESNKMLEIIQDTCGIHDFLLAPCCDMTMKNFYDMEGDHLPSCRNNLTRSLIPFGIKSQHIPTAFNIFMNVTINSDMSLSVDPPEAKAGDYIIFKTHLDQIIGLTSCSAGASNNFTYKPIQYEILDSINFF